ncbi:MAG: type II toxin-antitoxin system VapC family toxin [Gammaproteobacteria bacterium]
MYLIDTNIISESRKGRKANKGVRQFFSGIIAQQIEVFLSVVTIGELRRGIELIRYRGDERQAQHLEEWLSSILSEYSDYILEIDEEIAQVWGKLRAPHPKNALDKQIAATALIHDLTVVTRNRKDYEGTGVKIINPFDE